MKFNIILILEIQKCETSEINKTKEKFVNKWKIYQHFIVQVSKISCFEF